jgi:hypothetical protein
LTYSIPSGYDPVTINHWLWYKCQCHEGPPASFQSLFENIIKRAEPKFDKNLESDPWLGSARHVGKTSSGNSQ